MWNKKILYSALVCIASLGLYAQPVIRQAHSNRFPATYDRWQEALLAGNGKMGIMVFGNPLHETVVFTDRFFNFPGAKSRTFAEVPRDTLDLIKKYCAIGKFKEANDLAVRTSHWHDGGEGGRHPGFVLKIDMDADGEIKDYRRISNYETGEIIVRWSDDRGEWERRSFVSRDANVSVFELQAPASGGLSCAVSLQMLEEMNFPKGMRVNNLHAKDYLNIRVNYAPPMDAEGYVTVRGRSKNMLLTSSGQNIYPEEIESKLNNMPYVSESLIVLQKEKLVALIYPDFDDAFAHGLQQADIIKVMEANRVELNQQLPNYSQISKVKIHFEEFEKTAKKSIKRFMYQEAKG